MTTRGDVVIANLHTLGHMMLAMTAWCAWDGLVDPVGAKALLAAGYSLLVAGDYWHNVRRR